MATISSTGVGSGLDVNTIVTSLMSVEKQPLQKLQTAASGIQTRLSAFATLQSQIASLGDVATRLADAGGWDTMQADSSDGTSVAISAADGAPAGSHTIEVSQLAQPQVLASGWYASSSSAVGTGTLQLSVGTTSGGTFTAKPGTTPVPITIDAAHQTLAGVRDAINAAKAGVTASIVTGASGSRLVLRSADGAASSVQLLVTDGDGNGTDAAGLSALAWEPAAAAGSGRNLMQTQAAQDAAFTVDGVALTSATNTPSDALQGVTLTLRKVTAGPVQLSVSVQAMAIRKNVNDFVNAFNALNTLVRAQTKADPSGASRGPLQADSTAVGVLDGMRSLLQAAVGGGSGASTLSAAGISLQQDGSLVVNDAKLSPLLSDPAQLTRLFAQAQSGQDASTRGIGVRFRDWAKSLSQTGGSLATRMDGLKRSQTLNQKQQDDEQDRLDRTEARLRKQYQSLDSQMTQLNATMARMKSSLGLA